MAEYFTIRTDTGLRATFPFTDWHTYLRLNDGKDIGGHRVTSVTTLYDAENMNHAISIGHKRLEHYENLRGSGIAHLNMTAI